MPLVFFSELELPLQSGFVEEMNTAAVVKERQLVWEKLQREGIFNVNTSRQVKSLLLQQETMNMTRGLSSCPHNCGVLSLHRTIVTGCGCQGLRMKITLAMLIAEVYLIICCNRFLWKTGGCPEKRTVFYLCQYGICFKNKIITWPKQNKAELCSFTGIRMPERNNKSHICKECSKRSSKCSAENSSAI